MKKIFVILAVVGSVAALNVAVLSLMDEHAALWAGKIFNFAVLAAALVWGVPKMFGKSYGAMFAEERENVGRSLREAESRRLAAEAKLKEVEEKLRAMDAEIARLAAKAREDAVEDAKRLKAQADVEAKRIAEKAEREIELRVEAAKRELRRYAAERIAGLATEEAAKRVDGAARERLFAKAVKTLEEKAQ